MFSNRTSWDLEPNRFTLAHQQLLSEGREILDLTASNPTKVGLSYDENEMLDALRNPKSLAYDPSPKGLRSAREAVAKYYSCGSVAPVPATGESTKQTNQTEQNIDPESLILTTSTSEAYSYVFRLLCNFEDEVLVPKPSYPLFEFLADLQDVKLISYPLIYDHGWQIDLNTLENAVTEKTRAVVLVNPNNPTGSYVSRDERARLNQFCCKQDLALIVDEVFLDYPHDGNARETFATNEEALTFTLSGLSKISALPQMKLAWLAVSGPKQQAVEALHRLEIIADTYLSLNAPVQLAAEALLSQRKKLELQLMRRIQANLLELDVQLSGQKSRTRLNLEGGWYAILRVPVTRTDEDLAIELLQSHSVLVHPGHFYDFPQDGYLVLSLITPEAIFREGISRILSAI